MDHSQFDLFRSITLDYFAKLAPDDTEGPVMEDPYLLFGDPLALDFTSLVRILGEYNGCIYITAPRETMENILRLHGETEINDVTLQDMSRELSNILAGNASHAFGENWRISVPESLTHDEFAHCDLPGSTFVMPIRWKGAESYLVVGLLNPEPQEAISTASA
jgi:hypothetical protein